MSEVDDLAKIIRRDYCDLQRFIAKRLPTPQDAADLTQEAFLRLIARTGEPVRSERQFLFATALNLVRDRARALAVRRAVEVDGELEQAPCPEPSPYARVEAKDLVRVLEAALLELTPRRRAALLLHRLDGMSQAAVAEALGLSVSSVEKHVRSALRHCARRLAAANCLAVQSSPGRRTR